MGLAGEVRCRYCKIDGIGLVGAIDGGLVSEGREFDFLASSDAEAESASRH